MDCGALTAILHLIIWKTPLFYLLYDLSRICKPYVAHQSRNLGQFLTVEDIFDPFPLQTSVPTAPLAQEQFISILSAGLQAR